MPSSKLGNFWPNTLDLPLGKKSIFERKTNVILKASNQIRVTVYVAWDIF